MKKFLKPEELAEVKKLDLLTYLSTYERNELVGGKTALEFD